MHEAEHDTARSGSTYGERVDAANIIGTSADGEWRAYLPLNGRTSYYYPGENEKVNSSIRQVVGKLINARS